MQLTFLGLIEHFLKSLLQHAVSEHRHHTDAAVLMMLGLGCTDDEPFALEVDIGPRERPRLAGDADTSISGQCHQQSPLGIRQLLYHCFNILGRHVSASIGVALDGAADVLEGVALNQIPALGNLEKVTCVPASLGNGGFRQSVTDQLCFPCVRVGRGDALKCAAGEKVAKSMVCLIHDDCGAALKIDPLLDVLADERVELVLLQRRHQPARGQLFTQFSLGALSPASSLRFSGDAIEPGLLKLGDTAAPSLGLLVADLAQPDGLALASVAFAVRLGPAAGERDIDDLVAGGGGGQ